MLTRDEIVFNNSETKILWAIYETLQEIKERLPAPATREQVPVESKERPPTYTCKVCGQVYDNKGSFMACARKHKKEGA